MSLTIRRAEINIEASVQADELHKIRARQERREGARGTDRGTDGGTDGGNAASAERGAREVGRRQKYDARSDPANAAAEAAQQAIESLAHMEQTISPPQSNSREPAAAVKRSAAALKPVEQRVGEEIDKNAKRETPAGEGGVDPGSGGSGRGPGIRGGGMVAKMIKEREEAAAKLAGAKGAPAAPGSNNRAMPPSASPGSGKMAIRAGASSRNEEEIVPIARADMSRTTRAEAPQGVGGGGHTLPDGSGRALHGGGVGGGEAGRSAGGGLVARRQGGQGRAMGNEDEIDDAAIEQLAHMALQARPLQCVYVKIYLGSCHEKLAVSACFLYTS